MSDPRRYAPAAARNRQAILDVLHRVLPPDGLVLEIASGSGEHAAFFAPNLAPNRAHDETASGGSWRWQPTDIDPDALSSIDAHARDADPDGRIILPAKRLDTAAPQWPVGDMSGIVCINMIHIAPWSACEGLMRGAGRLLVQGGLLCLYGPFKRGGAHTAPSNDAFDASLRARDAAWGVRDLDDVDALAAQNGLALDAVIDMPANNLTVVFRR